MCVGWLVLLFGLLCVVVVVVVAVVAVVVVVVCVRRVRRVWCGTLKTAPCVDSKRLRVKIQSVSVCTGNKSTCRNTCGHGAGTHGHVSKVHTEAF